MISNRDELIDSVYRWLMRDQTTDTFITADVMDTYIQLCESELNRELKIMDLEATEAITLSTSNDYITLPTGFRGVQSFEFTSKPFDIDFFQNRRAMKEAYSTDIGRPKGYTIFGDKFIFSCTPDSAYTMTLDYYKTLEALTEDDDTNIILDKFPDVYLYGTVRQALINLNNPDRLEAIATLYQNAISRILEDDKNARFPVGARLNASPRRQIG